MRSMLTALVLGLLVPAFSQAACCYFSAKNTDILQPAQKVFISWDPVKKIETFTVQPKFEGNALDFGMVIPTPSQPKLNEMPRDFFKHFAIYTIMKRREFPHSQLLPQYEGRSGGLGVAKFRLAQKADRDGNDALRVEKKPTVIVLERVVQVCFALPQICLLAVARRRRRRTRRP